MASSRTARNPCLSFSSALVRCRVSGVRAWVFHERQLVRVLAEYETHYNRHRPHRALDQRPPITGFPILFDDADRPAIRRVEVPGALINEYRRAA